MVVRGAPAIGCAAAFGLALEGARVENLSRSERERRLSKASATLRSSRPTAVNLFWALDRMDRVWRDTRETDGPTLTRRLRSEATRTVLFEANGRRVAGIHVQIQHRRGSAKTDLAGAAYLDRVCRRAGINLKHDRSGL